MASEISHVVYAARVLTNLTDSVKNPTYWMGTLFPNIYQLGSSTRHFCHPNVSLYSLVGNNDFTTGLRVHAWLDTTRNQFLQDNHVKERLPWHPCTPVALSLLEDQLLYDHFDDWNLIHRALNNIDNSEFSFVSDRAQINKWHSIVQEYFATAPTDKSRQEFLIQKGISKKCSQEINELLAILINKKTAVELIHNFWQHLEDILQ